MKSYAYLIAPLFGWIFAQGIKYVFSLSKDGLQLKDLYSSGGFPSSHTAGAVALASLIGLTEGFASSIFAVAATFSVVVMYDALGVRRSTGEHTILLKKMTKDNKQLKEDRDKLHIFLGHSPIEVFGGAVVGIVVGVAISLYV